MGAQRTRDRIIDIIHKMKENTVDRGCSPAEAGHFAAKCAEWIEKYQISEAELRADGNDASDVEVCQNLLHTGKRVFNPGMTAVVGGLAQGMCCKVVLLHQRNQAVYGIVGDALDADYVCQIATCVIPALQLSAALEGREHGYEKAGLVRWSNQYLTGAGAEICRRLVAEREERSRKQERQQLQLRLESAGNRERVEDLPSNVIDELIKAMIDGTFDQIVGRRNVDGPCTALILVTGETLAVAKREAVSEGFKKLYPRTRQTWSRSQYDRTARRAGREAGKRVGLRINIEGK